MQFHVLVCSSFLCLSSSEEFSSACLGNNRYKQPHHYLFSHYPFFYYSVYLMRIIIGPFSFWTLFIWLECIKHTTSLACSLLNTSVIIQLSIISNLEWISKFSDKVRMLIFKYSNQRVSTLRK